VTCVTITRAALRGANARSTPEFEDNPAPTFSSLFCKMIVDDVNRTPSPSSARQSAPGYWEI
jgi:hypothetical protein